MKLLRWPYDIEKYYINFFKLKRVPLSSTQTLSAQQISATQGPHLFSPRNPSVQHTKSVSSTQTSVQPKKLLTFFILNRLFYDEVTGVLNWCLLCWSLGLKRSGSFVLNWCVELTGVWNWGRPVNSKEFPIFADFIF